MSTGVRTALEMALLGIACVLLRYRGKLQFMSYSNSHRALHLCPILTDTGQNLCRYVSYSAILTGLFICVLFSQGKTYVPYSHRALHLCPILTGLNKCVLFSQG